MANCSIPSSTPASGQISTKSLRRSRKPNSASTSFFAALSVTSGTRRQTLRISNVQHATLNSHRSIGAGAPVRLWVVGRWILDVERWTFCFLRRVKGAWWPLRSSKPLSSRFTGRGRFDSYPLRRIILDFGFTRTRQRILLIANRNSKIEKWLKGGDIDVARADS
jgi:hypothetical protein